MYRSYLKSSPDEWAKMAITGYHKHNADRIIGESNNGGDMVEYTIRTIEKNIPFNQVHASRGKYIRAEPISALYEQNKIHHVGTFGDLEDQMCEWTVGDKSPDRLDALVWALTELMLKEDEVFEGTIIYDDPVNISTI
jgi:phage terminase large subunit-like protein